MVLRGSVRERSLGYAAWYRPMTKLQLFPQLRAHACGRIVERKESFLSESEAEHLDFGDPTVDPFSNGKVSRLAYQSF